MEVIVRKEFFIDLRLPYSVVRGEQIEIKAVLHNYTPNPITVSLDESMLLLSFSFVMIKSPYGHFLSFYFLKVQVNLMEVSHVCSAASKRGRFRQEVQIGSKTTRSLPFVIIPMKEGEFQIEVKAAVLDSPLRDGIIKMLRVVVREKKNTNLFII